MAKKILGKTLVILCGILLIVASLSPGRIVNVDAAQANTDWTISAATKEKIKDAIVLFVGSSKGLVRNTYKAIDSTNAAVKPVIMGDRTLVPVRFVMENYGATIVWNEKTRTVEVKINDKTVQMVLDSDIMKVNGQEIKLDVPAVSIEGRTFIPLRALVEQALGKKIFWDDRGLIVISDTEILDKDKDKNIIDDLVKGFTAGNIIIPSSTTAQGSGSSGFKHPGILHSQMDLEIMKAKVNGTEDHPMKKGYLTMTRSPLASPNYVPKPFADVEVVASGGCESEKRFREDAHAAYANALEWVITGDAKYKDASIRILNAWANTFKTIYCKTSERQPTLEAAWALPIWVNAAEIIRYYDNGSAGWAEEEIAKFEEFVRAMLKYVNGLSASAANWNGSRSLARMAAGVFLNDQNLYKQGYNEMIGHIRKIGKDGTPSENTRDFVHSQYNVILTSQGAEIAFQQGDGSLYQLRLVGETEDVKPLLWRQAEFYTGQLLGGSKLPTGGIDYSKEKYHNNPPYEMVLSRYKYHYGLEMPNTEEYVLKYSRPVDVSEDHFVGWTTLTHGELNYKDKR